ncbi:MAG: hypothetical protein FIB01_05425 [Gemmatimonadetes bacterium]|nr:hypothetical protein [Gemmatimonadota bacterium]
MRRSILLTVLATIGVPALLSAQQPATAVPERVGFWISAGLGGGPRWLSCDDCTEKFGQGFGMSIALGGTVGPQWLVGADIIGFFPWSGMDEGYEAGETDGFGAVLFTARHYPRVEKGLFLTGGLGLGQIDVQADQLEAKGFVAKIGIGYDLRAGRNFSFTPMLSLAQTFATDTERAGDAVESGMNFGMANVGVSLTWH